VPQTTGGDPADDVGRGGHTVRADVGPVVADQRRHQLRVVGEQRLVSLGRQAREPHPRIPLCSRIGRGCAAPVSVPVTGSRRWSRRPTAAPMPRTQLCVVDTSLGLRIRDLTRRPVPSLCGNQSSNSNPRSAARATSCRSRPASAATAVISLPSSSSARRSGPWATNMPPSGS